MYKYEISNEIKLIYQALIKMLVVYDVYYCLIHIHQGKGLEHSVKFNH